MIPHKLKLTGFKRFKSSSVLLDRKVLAFVGANEAGKSSFLEALLCLENYDPIEKDQLTKGVNFESDDVIIRIDYLLEEEEKKKLEEFNGQGNPRYYSRSKKVDGTVIHEILGKVRRNDRSKTEVLKILQKFGELKTLKKFSTANISYAEEGEIVEDDESLEQLINQCIQTFPQTDDLLDTQTSRFLRRIMEILANPQTQPNRTELKYSQQLYNSIEQLLEEYEDDHPRDLLLNHFSENRPKAILFGNEERYLKGSYSIQELSNPSPAISNIFSLANLDLTKLLDSIADNDTSERLLLMENANASLKRHYDDSWSQSHVYPQLMIDKDSVNIQIFSSGSYTEITKRSDGLKQYISLKAFLTTRGSKFPILLIDEAEIHLHYAAQSDLVREFETQNLVNSIIYTTHSAGCLPSDLGSGIRVVQAELRETGEDNGTSHFKNSIWNKNDAGFSPILLAMGANFIAFTLARKALFAEGPSETVLVPRLLREATGNRTLDFQVAPGIATISELNVPELELEAAKEVYLVDGDKGGNAIRKKLIKGGVHPSRIVSLKEGCTIEDYVKPEYLVDSINRELAKSGLPKLEVQIQKIPIKKRLNWLETECRKKEIAFPSKVRIAENIVREASTEAVVEERRVKELSKLYTTIVQTLND